MNRRWLFVCSCIALVTSAFTFIVRGDVLQAMGDTFGLTQQQKGSIEGAVFAGMALSMLGGGFVCDLFGMKRIMWLAFVSHLIGTLGTIFTPHFAEPVLSYYWLYLSSILMGCGNGLTEVGVNPLVATLYPTRKTHYLNVLHAWWPGGLVIGGILARLMGKGLDLGFWSLNGLGVSWQTSLCLIAAPAIFYGLMLLPAKFPVTERVRSGVTTETMFKEALRPMFLLWAFCMLLTAATEIGPQKWQESVMTRTAHVSGTLILVYTSGMMFVLRHFAGPIVRALSPVGMLTVSSFFSAIGLYLLSYADNAVTAFGYATVFGFGIAYFWPTMLGVAAERFPKGGALILALMGSAGNLAISQVLPQMGRIYDDYTVASIPEDIPSVVVVDKVDNKTVGSTLTALVDSTAKLQIAIDLQPRDGLSVSQLYLHYIDARKAVAMHLLPLVADGKPNPAAIMALQVHTQPIVSALSMLGYRLGDMQEALKTKFTSSQQLIAALEAAGLENDDRKVANLETTFQTLKRDPDLLRQQVAIESAEAIGAAMAFRWVSILPVALIFIFGAITIWDNAQGGYKPEILISREEENELFAGGIAGPIE